ncbi:MAG: RNA polymerase sigma factor [Bacteroidales bacterium]|nr:RNA polymerase sigma factor [Bacteroidales bacterium]
MQANKLTSVFIRLRNALRSRAQAIAGAEADDALQDAFCRLWSSQIKDSQGNAPASLADGQSSQPDGPPPDQQDDGHAQALTFTAVRHASIDLARRQRARAQDPITSDFVADDPPADADELYEQVSDWIRAHLPERDREMLLKREMHGYEYEELAELYGTTAANARMIVSRARQQVRQAFRDRHKPTT